jgi:hypothetical protein
VGGLTGWSPWRLFLGSDPAISLFGWHGALGKPAGLPELGPWVLVPEQAAADEASAIAWARENVGQPVIAPSDRRHRMTTEREPDTYDYGFDFRFSRAPEQRLALVLFTYDDLLARTAALAEWLSDVRETLVAPVAGRFGDRLIIDPTGEAFSGAAYGAALNLHVVSTEQESCWAAADEEGWQQALDRLRRGELRELSAGLTRSNGRGAWSHYQAGLEVSVTLRDQFSDLTGPLADGHPATIVLEIGRSLLEEAGIGGVAHMVDLMQQASTRFEVAHGYVGVSSWRMRDRSQYENRHGTAWNGTRLDVMTRGVHWGNLIGSKHLAAIGGEHRLRQLHAAGRISGVEQWSTEPDLWWYQLTDDPYGPVNQRADEVGALLQAITPRRLRPAEQHSPS